MKRDYLVILILFIPLLIVISGCSEDLSYVGIGGNDNTQKECAKDLKTCPNGTTLSRTGPNCDFPACPEPVNTIICPQDTKTCWNGTIVGRKAPSCNFEECPAFVIPANTCKYDPDCKLVMTPCSCESVPVSDPRDWINGSYCRTNECIYNDVLIAKAYCDDTDVCKKVIQNTTICSDSDSGIEYNITGTGKVRFEKYPITLNTLQDSCKTSNILNEVYCLDSTINYLNITEYSCPFGCLNGACQANTTG